MMIDVAEVDFESYADSVPRALDAVNAGAVLAEQQAVLLKPNLINASPHPITAHPDCCVAVIEYIRRHSNAKIVIGEGCGEPSVTTLDVYDSLGYTRIAGELDVELVDLNDAPLVCLEDPSCSVFPEMYIPEIVMSHFLISLPVLKAHSLATITGTLKNMIGVAPPKHYSGRFGSWQKAVFHGEMQQSIMELNKYRHPDLSLLDASIGMPDFHLGGSHCDPPVAKLVAGFDPWAVDRKAADLLGLDWRTIRHLAERD